MSAFDPPGTAECSFAGTAGAVSQVRAWTRARLDKLGVTGGVVEDAVLVASELATNSVQHSRSSGPHGSFLVRLRRGVSRLRLEVVDAGGVTEPMARRNGHPGNGTPHPLAGSAPEESGHGLALVEAFTTRWWTRGDATGRTVGAELSLDGGS